jgi:hypothetical protein
LGHWGNTHLPLVIRFGRLDIIVTVKRYKKDGTVENLRKWEFSSLMVKKFFGMDSLEECWIMTIRISNCHTFWSNKFIPHNCPARKLTQLCKNMLYMHVLV